MCTFVNIDDEHYLCIQSGNYHRCTEAMCPTIDSSVSEGVPYCPLTGHVYPVNSTELFDESGHRRTLDPSAAARSRRTRQPANTKSDVYSICSLDMARRQARKLEVEISAFVTSGCHVGDDAMATMSTTTTDVSLDSSSSSSMSPEKRHWLKKRKRTRNEFYDSRHPLVDATELMKRICSLRESSAVTAGPLYVLEPKTIACIAATCARLWSRLLLAERVYTRGCDGDDDGDDEDYDERSRSTTSRPVAQSKLRHQLDYKHMCLFVICNCIRTGLSVNNVTFIRPRLPLPTERYPDRKMLPRIGVHQATYTKSEHLILWLLRSCTKDEIDTQQRHLMSPPSTALVPASCTASEPVSIVDGERPTRQRKLSVLRTYATR